MKTHKERLRVIKEHFANITLEEFEENMLKCGYGRITSPTSMGFKSLIEIDKIDE